MFDKITESFFNLIGVVMCVIIGMIILPLFLIFLIVAIGICLIILGIMIPAILLYLLIAYIRYVILKKQLKGFFKSINIVDAGGRK